jgi:hypothetical protein
MGAFDYNTVAGGDFELIPDKTVAVVQLNIRPGNAGEDGLLKRSKNGEAEMLDCQFTVVEGKFAKRKFFGIFVVSGTTDGHTQAADITRNRFRNILESARGIKPQDVSETAKKARIADLHDFDGVRFVAQIDIEKGRDGYRDKNVLGSIITPDRKEWHQVEQIDRPLFHATQPAAADAPPSNAIVKPAWAQ